MFSRSLSWCISSPSLFETSTAGFAADRADGLDDESIKGEVWPGETAGEPSPVPLEPNRAEPRAGDFLEGTVLLRCTPTPLLVPPNPEPGEEFPGLTPPLESFDWRDDTEMFLRIPWLRRRRLSGPALALEADRPMFALGFGEDGVAKSPPCTSLFVFSSIAVPDMPIKKLS